MDSAHLILYSTQLSDSEQSAWLDVEDDELIRSLTKASKE